MIFYGIKPCSTLIHNMIEVATGQSRAEQDRTGQDRTERDKTEKNREGHLRKGRE